MPDALMPSRKGLPTRTLALTPAIMDALEAAVGRGVPIDTAVQAAGISRTAFYEWLKAAERGTWQDGTPVTEQSLGTLREFSDRIARARAEHEQKLVQAINDAVGVVGKSGIPEWRPALELLKHHPQYRREWGQHITHEHAGKIDHTHELVRQLEQKTDEELEALEAALALEAGE